MSSRGLRWLALMTLALGLIAGACSSSSASPPGATATAPITGPTALPPSAGTPAAISETSAPAGCPTAATVNAALGTAVKGPSGITGGGSTLPAGATGVVCEYRGPSANILIELLSNISPSAIDLFSAHFPVAYTSVSGVGDQARAFRQSLAAGKDNEGVVATKGTTLVAITATDSPATLAQVEALAGQLL